MTASETNKAIADFVAEKAKPYGSITALCKRHDIEPDGFCKNYKTGAYRAGIKKSLLVLGLSVERVINNNYNVKRV